MATNKSTFPKDEDAVSNALKELKDFLKPLSAKIQDWEKGTVKHREEQYSKARVDFTAIFDQLGHGLKITSDDTSLQKDESPSETDDGRKNTKNPISQKDKATGGGLKKATDSSTFPKDEVNTISDAVKRLKDLVKTLQANMEDRKMGTKEQQKQYSKARREFTAIFDQLGRLLEITPEDMTLLKDIQVKGKTTTGGPRSKNDPATADKLPEEEQKKKTEEKATEKPNKATQEQSSILNEEEGSKRTCRNRQEHKLGETDHTADTQVQSNVETMKTEEDSKRTSQTFQEHEFGETEHTPNDGNKHSCEQKEVEELHEKLRDREKELNECHEELQTLKQQIDAMNKLKYRQEDDIQNLQRDLNRQRDIISGLRMDLIEKEGNVKELCAKNKDLTSRFSKAAADKMQRNNPNVADLSDEYRTTNIAEKYRQLYDAPWTSAYRALRNESGDDKGNVKLLLETLMDIYNYCKELAVDQENKLKCYIQFPVQDCTAQIKKKEIEDRQRHALLDLRKQVVVGLHQEVFEGYFNDKKKKQADGNEVRLSKPVMEKMKPYWQKCVEVCWPMVVHNPPLTLHAAVKAGDPVDEKIYNLRSDGDIIDTLVWPPLYVGEREALLAKGVVEAKKTMTRV